MSTKRMDDFDYTNDRLVVADMDSRDKSFVFKIVKAINGLGDEIDEERTSYKNLIKGLEARIERLEKGNADKIVNVVNEGSKRERKEKDEDTHY